MGACCAKTLKEPGQPYHVEIASRDGGSKVVQAMMACEAGALKDVSGSQSQVHREKGASSSSTTPPDVGLVTVDGEVLTREGSGAEGGDGDEALHGSATWAVGCLPREESIQSSLADFEIDPEASARAFRMQAKLQVRCALESAAYDGRLRRAVEDCMATSCQKAEPKRDGQALAESFRDLRQLLEVNWEPLAPLTRTNSTPCLRHFVQQEQGMDDLRRTASHANACENKNKIVCEELEAGRDHFKEYLQALEAEASVDPAGPGPSRNEIVQLFDQMEDVICNALEAGCKRQVPGAMDVFEDSVGMVDRLSELLLKTSSGPSDVGTDKETFAASSPEAAVATSVMPL
jgi:hypothetical protein